MKKRNPLCMVCDHLPKRHTETGCHAERSTPGGNVYRCDCRVPLSQLRLDPPPLEKSGTITNGPEGFAVHLAGVFVARWKACETAREQLRAAGLLHLRGDATRFGCADETWSKA
jgi:hypothetical protein